MNHHFSTTIFSIALILSVLLSACAAAPAVVEPIIARSGATLGASETVRGLRAVYNTAPGTFIMQLRDMYVFAWPKGSNYAFTVLCTGTCPDFNSLRINTLNLASMTKSLQDYGWRMIEPAALPAAITKALTAYSLEAVMASVQCLTNVILVPIIVATPAYQAPVVAQ
jgi:hypothetical protein